MNREDPDPIGSTTQASTACGGVNQTPCAGHACTAGHYDSQLNLCDYCGTVGQPCCNKAAQAGVPDCYGGACSAPQAGDGWCVACGGAGQPPCPSTTCGLFEQAPCAGTVCSEGHYDSAWHVCDSCGEVGQPCCNRGEQAAVPDCYGGACSDPQANDGWCVACGGAGQPTCPSTTCGLLDQPPCAGRACTQGHYDSLWTMCDYCGELGQPCCNMENVSGVSDCYDGAGCSAAGSSGWCVACGAAGEAPCGKSGCDAGTVLGPNGSCVACGGSTQPWCSTGTECVAPNFPVTFKGQNLCSPCGSVNAPACNSTTCNAGLSVFTIPETTGAQPTCVAVRELPIGKASVGDFTCHANLVLRSNGWWEYDVIIDSLGSESVAPYFTALTHLGFVDPDNSGFNFAIDDDGEYAAYGHNKYYSWGLDPRIETYWANMLTTSASSGVSEAREANGLEITMVLALQSALGKIPATAPMECSPNGRGAETYTAQQGSVSVYCAEGYTANGTAPPPNSIVEPSVPSLAGACHCCPPGSFPNDNGTPTSCCDCAPIAACVENIAYPCAGFENSQGGPGYNNDSSTAPSPAGDDGDDSGDDDDDGDDGDDGDDTSGTSDQVHILTPGCTPQTCASQGVKCGTVSDTCGTTLTCGPACVVSRPPPGKCPSGGCQ